MSLKPLVAIGLLLAPAAATGQQLTPIAPHAWRWLATDARSANSTLFVGDSIALVVDPGLTPALAREFLTAVRRQTNIPVRYAVLTHWHPDHALGITCLADRGLTVVAHGKTRRSLAERAARSANEAGISDCKVALPDSVVNATQRFDLGGVIVEVSHPGWGHTAGDLVVWAPTERVLATGDLFNHNASPYLDEGHPRKWLATLDALIARNPRAIVAGHFGPSAPPDLIRFRDYLRTIETGSAALLAQGVAPAEIPARLRLSEFRDFGQFPEYNATFRGNAASVVAHQLARPAARGVTAGFTTVATLDVGLNPHQIAFSADGSEAYVAVAGSNRVMVVDAIAPKVIDSLPIDGTPLGVLPVTGSGDLLVTRFAGDSLIRLDRKSHRQTGALAIGGIGASLFGGPLPGGEYLVSVERTDRVHLVDPLGMKVRASYPTGRRPFPPAATSDGRLAFVPGYDDGTVTVIDLWNQRIRDTVAVGARPSGGTVLPGDVEYAVAVRGANRVVFINTASRRVVDSLVEGIGESPFSVVVSPNGRLAFVNNTASHDISVIDLGSRRVIARIPVPDIPIVVAVHPDGKTLWVSSEGVDRLSVIAIPADWQASVPPPDSGITEVAVMGMIHRGHRTSTRWGLEQVRETVRRFRPDAVCVELPTDRWDRIWSEFTERGVITDPRARVFPEYTDALLHLSVEMGFEVIPCAAWTQEMSDLRNVRIRQFDTEAAWAGPRAEYARRLAAVDARYSEALDAIDDPRVIHSSAYDERQRERLSLYDEYQNELIGPGGWSSINAAHLRLIDRAVASRRGQRVLVTFGAGHKYPFLDHLARDPGVRLIDLGHYLP